MVQSNQIRSMTVVRLAAFAAGATLCTAAGPAYAYIGPGAGLSAIGTVLGFVAVVFFGIVGFVWYPVKRLIRRRRASAEQPQPAAGPGGE